MNAGDTFRFRSGDTHLWFVISDPAIDASRVLLVNMSSWRADKEQTCLLNPGDHPEVEKNSCIIFAKARVHPDAHLEHLLSCDKIVTKEPVSAALLLRIRESAATSRHLRLDFGRILIEQGLVDE